MILSMLLYTGLVVALFGAVMILRPLPRLGVTTRVRALLVAVAGALLVAVSMLLPAPESRITEVTSALDGFAPVWQFNEVHERTIPASPDVVYAAIRQVRADEITLFRALTWIRRGGKELPPGILNPVANSSIIDVAIQGGFVLLSENAPSEIVIGTMILAPTGTQGPVSAAHFQGPLPAGFAVAAMNFRVRPDGVGGSRVRTETRVFASDAGSRRRFAAYWRVIYPGSALIRRMWLRAIETRATRPPTT